MISYLRIRGLALASDLTLELGAGLTVLTGETGAGKSLIVDALTLLRGARGRADLVRAGETQAIIDAQLDLSGAVLHRAEESLQAHGLPNSDAAALVLQRVVMRSGRGRCLVQGQLVPRAAAAELGSGIIDVCSQHEHHSLTAVGRHGELLDAYAGLEGSVTAYSQVWHALRDAEHALGQASTLAAQAASREELLRHQLDELVELDPQPGEYAALAARLELLQSAAHWQSFAADARHTLYDSDDSIADRLTRLARTAESGASQSERLVELGRELDAARASVVEAARHASKLAEDVEFEPGELERVEARVNAIERVAEKHRLAPECLPERWAQLGAELDGMSGVTGRIAELAERVAELDSRARGLAAELSEQRQRARQRLARDLERELSELYMPSARLDAHIETDTTRLGPRGFDRVELSFSANRGEPLAPLVRVASGGELSRVLLALKSVLASSDAVSTYVFDEVDAGVSGAVAESIGHRLARAALARQVICVTHLPQIAAFADVHLRVEKVQDAGRTITRVSRLDPSERIEELAGLLGGARITQSARAHARELLEAAQQRGAARLATVVPLVPEGGKRRGARTRRAG